MPSVLEYWTTMPYSTCNNYLKRYTDVTALKAGIQRHAFSNGVQINLGENINDIARFRQGIPKQKRPIAKNILEAPPPKRARIAEVFSDIRIENAQVPMQIEELQAAGFNAPPVTAFNCVRKPLVLNGITIEVDSMTLMVNATQMCSAAGKLFGHYRQLESTETLLQELYFVMEISSVGLIFSNIGGRPELEGTWVHRYVAYDLARWISAEIFLQYTMWMDELYIENYTLLTQIEELQAAVVDALPAIAVNGARKPLVLNGITIEVDPQTLIMNATQMCGAAGKLFGHYWELDSTEQFLKELSSDIGIPILELYEKTKGGRGTSQDTWVDWRVALHLSQWLSPTVQVQVTKWIGELRIATATVIDDLQAAVVDAPPAIVVVNAPPAIALNNDSPVIVAVAAPPAIVVNNARKPLVLNGITIEVDPQTLMVNATQMCRAAGKLFGNYRQLESTEKFLQELSSVIGIPITSVIGIPITGLIYTIQGGRPELQGTWVDWRVALHLAQWLSPAVQVQVTKWIDELRIENTQLLTQIEELQAAVVNAPPDIAINGADIIEFVLKLSNGADFIVPVRCDGYVNVTKICQAAGKRLQNYKDRVDSKHFIDRYVALTGIQANAIFEVIQGGNLANVEQGTFAHPDIAIHIAQWCSADFSIQVSRWVRQLMTTGRVEIGNEMSPQQLDNAWQKRVQIEQAHHQQATEALKTRHQQATEALETRITTMERQGELAEQKTREELDAAIKTLARDTEQVPQFPDGANVLYAGYIGNWLIKYGQSSNLTRRLAEHRRHYPEFMLIKALPCDNAVASEKKLREFVAKKNIGGNYNNEKEIIGFRTQEDVYKLIGAMQRSCRNKDSAVSVELKRIEADVEIKRIEAEVEMKRMDVEKDKIETMRMELLMQDKITFEQYLQMK